VSETRSSIRRVSTTISAYTADLAARIDGLVLDQEKTETDVVRATGEIAATEDGLKKIGEELLGLGQLTNNVSMVVEGKADQMEIDTLKQAMLRMDAAVTKNR
ncbi:unnamed protein product, partial [Sphacelaria rigidula]